MKVGIVVVYLVSEENEKLLDIHLSQIEEHTHTPYAIYASVNRLLPRFRQRLERSTKVKICECPTTELRDREEHSFYLDYLVRHAVEDGVSHVVTLHVDSFPVRSDWIEVLTGKLSDSCVLVAIQESKESVLPSTMLRSNQGEDHHIIGSVYDDLIFHLGAATRSMKHFRADFPKRRERKVRDASRRILKQLGNVVFTQRAYENVRALVPRRVVGYFVPQIGAHEANQNAYEYVRASLLEDPESYLAYLRTGKRQ
jgi:hypothetical protein